LSIKSGCPDIFLDVHVAVDNIDTVVDSLLSSKGADRITVQYESFNGDVRLFYFVENIRAFIIQLFYFLEPKIRKRSSSHKKQRYKGWFVHSS
jgi:pentose-5-phosphate-3-epimerase